MRNKQILGLIKSFVLSVENYCNTIVMLEKYELNDFIVLLHSSVAELYCLGLKLKEELRKMDEEIRSSSPEINMKEYTILMEMLKAKLGRRDYFHGTYDPVLFTDKDVVDQSLSGNLADIYMNLNYYLEYYNTGDPGEIVRAVRGWVFLFENKVGNYLIDTMRVLHYILADEYWYLSM
jgi:hypothetical protein